jgi:predicted PurR-regulated permease PerM
LEYIKPLSKNIKEIELYSQKSWQMILDTIQKQNQNLQMYSSKLENEFNKNKELSGGNVLKVLGRNFGTTIGIVAVSIGAPALL